MGFFNGRLRSKADFGWPGGQESYQTKSGVNGFGLYDMAGNAWQWCNDWYAHDYYANSPTDNPVGPARGSLMPDGKPYHSMRGGGWFNGDYMRARISNHVPSYYRGPHDPNHPYYAFGFRVALPIDAENRPVIKPTPSAACGGPGGSSGRWSAGDGEGGRRPRGNDQVARMDDRQPPPPQEQGREPGQGQGQGQGQKQGSPPPFHLFPRNMEDRLNLTDSQRQQIEDLQKEAKAKLYQILTPQQQTQFEQLRPPRRQSQGAGEGGSSPTDSSDRSHAAQVAVPAMTVSPCKAPAIVRAPRTGLATINAPATQIHARRQ